MGRLLVLWSARHISDDIGYVAFSFVVECLTVWRLVSRAQSLIVGLEAVWGFLRKGLDRLTCFEARLVSRSRDTE